MRLGYFTMPVHPMHRSWVETLKEDREAIILADQLGFHDAFMGEHLTDACENITNSMMFQASLITATKRIKLATGTSNLTQMNPVLIAVQAAMFVIWRRPFHPRRKVPRADLGCRALGSSTNRNGMFAEAIDIILAIWEHDPPRHRFPDNRYKVSTARTMTLDLASTTSRSPTRGRGRRSWGPWWHRSRPVSCRWESATSIRCRPTFAVEAPQVALGELPKGRPRRAEANVADWRVARAIFRTTTRPRRATAATTRTARIASIIRRCTRR
jgi:hypothetical protein